MENRLYPVNTFVCWHNQLGKLLTGRVAAIVPSGVIPNIEWLQQQGINFDNIYPFYSERRRPREGPSMIVCNRGTKTTKGKLRLLWPRTNAVGQCAPDPALQIPYFPNS